MDFENFLLASGVMNFGDVLLFVIGTWFIFLMEPFADTAIDGLDGRDLV